jgi:carbon storage regulator
MLILSRKTGMGIYIGEEIEIRVLGLQGTYVKIGIEAPETVRIYREEVLERIRAEGLKENFNAFC